MVDSFKDIYAKDKEAQKEEKLDEQVVTTSSCGDTHTSITIDPEKGAVMTVLDSVPEEHYKTPETVTLSEDIKSVLTEQREQSAKVLESVMKTNTKIANSVTKLVKSNVDTNDQLVEAILALTEKIGLLETKLEAIENLEIPTPVVNLTMPTKTKKIVHRDKKGLIDFITEEIIHNEERDGDKE